MAKLTNVSCIYTGGGIYVYQAMYNGYWIYGGLDSEMEAYTYEPFKYWRDTDSTESPDEYIVANATFPTWADIIRSLADPGPDTLIEGSADECIDIVKHFQTLTKPVNIE